MKLIYLLLIIGLPLPNSAYAQSKSCSLPDQHQYSYNGKQYCSCFANQQQFSKEENALLGTMADYCKFDQPVISDSCSAPISGWRSLMVKDCQVSMACQEDVARIIDAYVKKYGDQMAKMAEQGGGKGNEAARQLTILKFHAAQSYAYSGETKTAIQRFNKLLNNNGFPSDFGLYAKSTIDFLNKDSGKLGDDVKALSQAKADCSEDAFCGRGPDPGCKNGVSPSTWYPVVQSLQKCLNQSYANAIGGACSGGAGTSPTAGANK